MTDEKIGLTWTLCRTLFYGQELQEQRAAGGRNSLNNDMGNRRMESMTVSEVSRSFHISTRMLRYYEKIGLISSGRREDYSYRVYDAENVKRLQYILILRKLRVPLKHIAVILGDGRQYESLELLKQQVRELGDEISALSTIRSVLELFVTRLDEGIRKKLQPNLLEDREISAIVSALRLPQINLKEKLSMDQLNEAQKVLNRSMDVRILYLPPATVASIQYTGENPEEHTGKLLRSFIISANLPAVKKDFRVFGFNNPSPAAGQRYYGYEFWVTVPEDMQVPFPFEKKQFDGGLYAAHGIQMGDFQEWQLFSEYLKSSEEYEPEKRPPFGMGGCLEEHLNPYSVYTGEIPEFTQLDLLTPVKRKDSSR